MDVEDVNDKDSFLEFARWLHADRTNLSDSYTGEWENNTIEDFLESAIRWAEDTGMGEAQGLAQASPWQRFAVFLFCGKIYE